MAGRNRLFDEYENIEGISKPSSSPTMIGIPTQLLPIKTTEKGGSSAYFVADVSNGKKKIKLWGHTEKQQLNLINLP